MAVKRKAAATKSKKSMGKAALAGGLRSRTPKKGGSFAMTARKAISEKKGKMMDKTKALFRSGKERMQAVDLQPIWQQVKKGVDSASRAVGKGSDRMKQKFGSPSEMMEKGTRKMKTGLGGAMDAVGRGAEKATSKALTLAKRMSVQYKISEQHRKLQVLLAELGGRVYDITKRSPQALNASDPDIMKLAGRIRDAEKALMALEEKAGALKNREGVR
ncbi:MAG: hypothetical protein A2X56_06030 [Nitrospirae bacterium GWC2_57_13]|nr:MAG: hypothetical protein A2X56_06030 [Nitrospirae bacterium GWC2_57_13]OGW42224.1 MAG: hypothetical protein A2X57_01400 [Nitrospirae bacterium GWD2_57_8]HAR45668.1 hypothetical protein [Nitrospiraceae bacterium]HAS55397.1 hypothetical protein [Nitrospiraceae bacterium]